MFQKQLITLPIKKKYVEKNYVRGFTKKKDEVDSAFLKWMESKNAEPNEDIK